MSAAPGRAKVAANLWAAGCWAGVFLAWVLGVVAAGAVIGAAAFPLWGVFFETGKPAGELVVSGARFMGFIFMIWAPAVALVACVMRAWKRNRARGKSQGASLL